MTKHEQYAASVGRTLYKVQGHVELWTANDGNWLYNRLTRRWYKAHLTVA